MIAWKLIALAGVSALAMIGSRTTSAVGAWAFNVLMLTLASFVAIAFGV